MTQPYEKHDGSVFRYVIYDRETQPIMFGEMDPEPYTYKRLKEIRAWIRHTDVPICIGVNRDGFLATIECMATALSNLGTPPEIAQQVYNAVEQKDYARAQEILDVDLIRHDQVVLEYIKHEEDMKKLELLSRLALAFPEIKDNKELIKQLPLLLGE
jgi:hypothetical protein